MCGKDGTPEREAIPKLKVSQKRALEHFSKLARHRKTKALQTLEHIREMCAIPEMEFSAGVGKLKALARVGLHFRGVR